MFNFFNKLLYRPNSSPTTPSVESVQAKPMSRWTESGLKATRQHLEGKSPESWTPEDHYRTVDFLVQRYLPQDSPITEAEWERTRQRLRHKVDQNIARVKSGIVETPQHEKANQELEKRRFLLRHSYDMPLDDFRKVVLPLLEKFPFGPAASSFSTEDIEDLWLASELPSQDTSPLHRYTCSDARGRLIGRFHDVVWETCTALRTNYQVLRRARNAGCTKVRCLVRERCDCLYALLDGATLPVDELIDSFEGRDTSTPVVPPPEIPCAHLESPHICLLTLLPIEPPLRLPGDDEEFSDWLENTLNGSANRK